MCEELDIEVPEVLKKINIDIDKQPAFSGNSTTYNGTLLEVLNQGVGAEESGHYGNWYQYADSNGGYPVLIQKTSSIFLPGNFTIRPIAFTILSPIQEAIEQQEQEEEAAASVAFTLSPSYPVDREIGLGQTASFSTSLAQGNPDPSTLLREWHVVMGQDDYAILEDVEVLGCSFKIKASNHLEVTATQTALSGTYKVYCLVSNDATTAQSRQATLKVRGLEVPPDGPDVYEFPFADVPEDAWYRNDVEIAHQNGLINGKSATSYAPDQNMTVAEAIKLAACMHQLHWDGLVTLGNGTPYWYSSYVDYSLANGIIASGYPDYNQMITRRTFVGIFYKALPPSEYPIMNSVANGAIPDVKTTDPGASEIYAFYRAGILVGGDSLGTFNPASNIRRSEVAAILTRMFDVSARKSITLP